MDIKTFIRCVNRYIVLNITTYWKKGVLIVPIDEVKQWGVAHTIEATDLTLESVLYKTSYELSIIYDAIDYSLRIKAKHWHEPRKGYFLYKYYVKDELKYIGRTNDPVSRYFQHTNEDARFRRVTRFEVYECNNKADMLLYERLLIGKYSPEWNIVDAEIGSTSIKIPELTFDRCNLFEFVEKY